MKAQKPAEGIMKTGDFGDAMFYHIHCDCGSPECAHIVEVEADDMNIMVNLHHTQHTKWWKRNRWAQIWQILTKGYAEMETTIVMNEQTALNYADALKSGVQDVKKFREARNQKQEK